jgi:beta-lactam-binding protein with PASTA domain
VGVYDVSLNVSGPGGSDKATINNLIQVKVPRVLVPKVRGLDRQAAEAKLKQAGFTSRVSVQDLPIINFPRGGQVFDQDPAENTKAPKGSRVDLKAYK